MKMKLYSIIVIFLFTIDCSNSSTPQTLVNTGNEVDVDKVSRSTTRTNEARDNIDDTLQSIKDLPGFKKCLQTSLGKDFGDLLSGLGKGIGSAGESAESNLSQGIGSIMSELGSAAGRAGSRTACLLLNECLVCPKGTFDCIPKTAPASVTKKC